MSKHTPGPWRIINDGERLWLHAPSGNVATFQPGYNILPANAALIAAAPTMHAEIQAKDKLILELLEALKRGLMYSEDYLDCIGGPIGEKPMVHNIARMKAAIKKAEEGECCNKPELVPPGQLKE